MTDSESESEGFSRPYQGLKTRTIFVFVAGHDDDEGRFLVVAHANIRALASAAAGDDRFKYLFDPHLNRVKNPDLLRQGCEYVVSKNKTIKAHNVPSRMRLKPKPPPVAPNVMRIREAHPLVTEKELENLVLHFAYFDDGEGRVALAEVHQLLHVCEIKTTPEECARLSDRLPQPQTPKHQTSHKEERKDEGGGFAAEEEQREQGASKLSHTTSSGTLVAPQDSGKDSGSDCGEDDPVSHHQEEQVAEEKQEKASQEHAAMLPGRLSSLGATLDLDRVVALISLIKRKKERASTVCALL
eukprot:m.104398 g.104398  ORF g.104398 m.104398 type:complete len:299 (-) comp18884_c0_seq4:27-923(-)